MSSRVERTGWRDRRISDRHGLWGFNCPALDIDFLMLEYDTGKAMALVEYKHEYASPQMPNHPSYLALIDLGTRAGVPVFAVRYADDFSWWRVVPLNDAARAFLPTRTQMTEIEWIALLYKVRGRPMPRPKDANDPAAGPCFV
jgi:hypothetical protein